jgi:phosphonate transport system substrate-binding protein
VALAVAVLLHGAPGKGAEPGAPYTGLAVGYSSALLADVDAADAVAATKIWTDRIIRRKGFDGESEARIFPDLFALETALAEGGVDLVFLLPQEYLSLAGHLPLVPVAISAPAQGVYEEFVLVVRADSGQRAVGDLRGRRLLVETDQRGTLPMIWLETLLLKAGNAPDAGAFFASVKATHKASQTVMPVFFGQADACITTRNALRTLAELNPQLSVQLKVVAESPGYVVGVGCLRQRYYDEHPTFFADNLADLHRDPQGRQILTLFRKGKLVAFAPSRLATVEELLREHGELAQTVARRP